MDGVRPVRVSASGLQRGSRPHMSGDVRRSPADSFWKEAKPRAEGNQGSERLQGRRLNKRGLPRGLCHVRLALSSTQMDTNATLVKKLPEAEERDSQHIRGN